MSSSEKKCWSFGGQATERHDQEMTSEVESLAQRIIAHIFANRFEPGMSEVAFRR